MADRKQVDWERIEAQYRAGLMSAREIATEHGVSHTAINKRARAEGWDRDLSAKIKAKAEALVSSSLVSNEVSKARAATEREVIEASALRIAQVRSEHRADITRMRALVLSLLAECEVEAATPGLFDEVADIIRTGQLDEDGSKRKVSDAYEKVLSLPARIKGVKDLADTLKTLVAMEREAYGIASEAAKVEVGGNVTHTAVTPEQLAEAVRSVRETY